MLSSRVSTVHPHQDIEFIRVDCMPMIVAVKQQADIWVHAYGDVLRHSAVGMLQELKDTMSNLSERLNATTDTLEQLQAVLRTIVDVQDTNMNMELAFDDVVERFRTLKVVLRAILSTILIFYRFTVSMFRKMWPNWRRAYRLDGAS
jgi:hypothetical protein